jgi:hypothetical protein
MCLTRPSTGPEFQWVVRPWRTASQSYSRPVAKVCGPGRSSARAAVNQSLRWPKRAVRNSAKARTSRLAASSSGQRAQTLASYCRSSSRSLSGWRIIHSVMSRTLVTAIDRGATRPPHEHQRLRDPGHPPQVHQSRVSLLRPRRGARPLDVEDDLPRDKEVDHRYEPRADRPTPTRDRGPGRQLLGVAPGPDEPHEEQRDRKSWPVSQACTAAADAEAQWHRV